MDINFTKLANFQDKQIEAWKTLKLLECKYLLFGGAAAGGKSYFLRWAALGLGLYYAGKYNIKEIPIGLFSEDYPTLKDRQIAKIRLEFPPQIGKLIESRDLGYVFHAYPEYGSFNIMLRNLDDPSKYASVEFAAILVEELTKNQESTFDDLRFRLRFPGISDVKFVGATNPGSIGHGWVKKKWVKLNADDLDGEQDRFFFIPAKYSDNKYVGEDYVHQLDALPPDKKAAFKDGSWDVFAGQYFLEWSYTHHVIKSFIPSRENTVLVGGMDWGRAKPFAFNLATVTKEEYEEITFYRTRTFLEVYGTEKNPEEWSNEIKKELKRFGFSLDDIAWVRADPKIFAKGDDNSVSIRDQFKNADSRWSVIKPANNDRINGWSVMHNWLSSAPDGLPYWQITENCQNLIRTLPELVHDENQVEDVDSDGEDHSGDANRYMLKHLKWIDASSKGVITDQRKPKAKMVLQMDDEGKQIPIDLDKFIRHSESARVIHR